MSIVPTENFCAVFYPPFYAAIALGVYAAEGLEVELRMSAVVDRTGFPTRTLLMRSSPNRQLEESERRIVEGNQEIRGRRPGQVRRSRRF